MSLVEIENTTTAAPANQDLSAIVVPLLKGVIYKENDTLQWGALLNLQSRVRDYLTVIGLELVLDESEGYAFLHAKAEDDATSTKMPRLVARRPLSFPVSLLLAQLRKKLAEFDASSGDTRLVMSRSEIVDLIRIFLPEGSNEAKLIDQVDTHIKKIVDLGFVRRLKPAGTGQESMYEVRRILKAFVDTQWLSEFDHKLDVYRKQILATGGVEQSQE